MKAAVLFVAGRYQRRHLTFYRRLAKGRYRIAVDGGYRFFGMAGVKPDLLIGDLDSLGPLISRIPPDLEVLHFPQDKDWTDLELALDYCLDKKFKRIDIVQPSAGEPDHFLANLCLLTREENGAADVRLYGPNYQVRSVRDGGVALRGMVGATVSIIPVSPEIHLSLTGTAYRARNLRLKRGETISTRNRVVSSRATVRVSGEALIYCCFTDFPMV